MNNNFKVNYYARDFASLKNELKNYAARYYADTMADLSEASLNSFLIDSIAYVGDVLSYYLDYQTNESFLNTALEIKNINNLAKSLGYKKKAAASTTGHIALYILIPDNGSGNTPDYNKIPVILKGSRVKAQDGGIFLITDDIIIDENTLGNSFFPARANTFGKTTHYVVKTYAPIVSGEIATEQIFVQDFVKFNKIFLSRTDIVEILSVKDSDGNEYYEVPNLSQNIVYKAVSSDSEQQKHSLRPISAQRRFVFDLEDDSIGYLMFGAARYRPDSDLTINPIAEPVKFSLNKYNKEYLQDDFFEPNHLLNGDSYGIGPENTTLTITYRYSISSPSYLSGQVTQVDNILSRFRSSNITDTEKASIISSIEVTNEEAIIGGNSDLTLDEVRDLSLNIYAAQGRAVTAKDYETLCYMMPAKFGSIKRVKAYRDSESIKNNINIYVISSDPDNKLVKCNTEIKNNLKTWLSEYKIITDTVDILDAKIINLGISFNIKIDPMVDKIEVLNNVKNKLTLMFSKAPGIGEYFNILDIYKEIRKNTSVLDIKEVKITNKTSMDYSNLQYNLEENKTSDGNFIKIPKNAIWEIKNPDNDIIGNFM